MLNRLLLFLFVIVVFPFLGQTSFSAGACNEIFPSIKIRAGYPQFFGDLWHNNDSYPDGIDFVDATVFNNRYGQGSRPSFFITNDLRNANYTVPGRSTMAIIGSSRYDVPVPPAGSSRYSDALYIEYTTRYVNITPSGESAQITHVECQPYEITWCGDGIVDSEDGEECDSGVQNGQAGSSCSSTCRRVTVPTPVNGVCNPSATGPQSSPLSSGSCTTGSPTGFTQTQNGNTTNYSWTCSGSNGGTNASCSASYTPPTPVCGSVSSRQNNPINSSTPNLCPSGSSVTNFQSQGTYPIMYSWNCSNSAGSSPLCEASYVPPNLECDPQYTGDISFPLSQGYCRIGRPESFSSRVVNGVTEYTWLCVPDGTFFSPTQRVSCSARYTPPQESPTCNSLSATPASGNVPLSVSMNCSATNATSISIDCGNSTNISGATGICTYSTAGTYTAQCRVNGTITNSACTRTITVNTPPPTGFDLSLKKYIDTVDSVGDAQTPPGIAKNTNNTLNYIIRVTNNGPANTSNTTTVTDTLPAGVNPSGNISAPGWSCNGAPVTQTITCTRSDTLAPGQTYPNISFSVVVTATTGTVTNTATVSNPAENPANNFGNNNTDPAVFSVTPPPTGFDLGVKKYVDTLSQDAQDTGSAIDKNRGSDFAYLIVVTNFGPATASGTTTVKDVLPSGIELRSSPTGTGWTCTNSANTISCTSTNIIASGVSYPTITIPVRVSSGTTSTHITNRAVVHNPNETSPCLINNTMPVGDESSCIDPKNTDPAVIRIPENLSGFDLFIKKYIGANDDAQTPPGPTLNTNGTFLYHIVVANRGPQSTTGVTVVQDILPSGVVYNSTSTGWTNGSWNCTYTATGTVVRCTSSEVVASGASYPTILIPVRITATSGVVGNIASVDNPNEIRRCNASGNFPSHSSESCTLDPSNSDPAYFTVSSSGGGGGTPFYVPVCVNGVSACATQVHSSLPACNIYNNTTCYATINECNIARSTLVCSGGGGPGGPPGGGGGGGPISTGRCGDGVLGSSPGEECDLGNGNSDAENSLCSTQCKLRIFTNPGANPITDIWMTIPTLSNIRLGYSWLDGEIGKIRFQENRMVIGANTPVFTIADTVGFGIKTQYKIPLIIEADKKMCLESSGNGLNRERICTTFGTYASGIDGFTNPDGKRYIVLGQGYYQVRNPDNSYSGYIALNNPNSITLFRGADTYEGKTLRNAFTGGAIGQTGAITLINVSTGDFGGGVTRDIPLVSLDVRVSGAMIGGTASTVYRARSIEAYLKPKNELKEFLAQFSSRIRGTNTTTTAITSRTGSTTSTANLNIGATSVNNARVSSQNQLDSYKLNGNPNIFSVKGDLTIERCPNSTFILDGVRTLVVEGNLTIMCNISYASNDTTSSWAFIVKRGNIIVDTSVTNLAGVYVAIADGVNRAGEFRSFNNQTTTNILRLNGSMYGNATPLFQSRLYVRGTNAYDILTPGVILSYSSRALMNPPPLLSSYLNNYSVTRVVR